MRFRFVVHKSLKHALVDGIGPAVSPFENFLSGPARHAEGGGLQADSCGSGDRPGLLDAFQHYRNLAVEAYDVIGFDVPATPLYVDLFSRGLDASISARLQALRYQASDLWKAGSVVVEQDTIAAYHQARATIDDASRARLSIWLSSIDIVVTPFFRDKAGPAKRAGVFEMLPAIRQCAQDLDIFSAAKHEPLRKLEAWPAFPNFIMPTPFFHDFADGLSALLTELGRTSPDLVRIHGIAISEFALGLFLREARLKRPLLRIRQVPVLQVKRLQPTADILAQFDADFYSATYPDVIAAGQDPLNHFIHHGFREHREWAPCG